MAHAEVRAEADADVHEGIVKPIVCLHVSRCTGVEGFVAAAEEVVATKGLG